MKCTACKSKIGMIKSGMFTIGLALRKAMSCPYCKTTIYRLENPTWEYFKLIIFVIFWFGLVLFLIAVIFGRVLGYKSALTICFWFWILVVIIFTSLILSNLAVIFSHKIYIKLRGRPKGL
jgi:hypothetical protein